VEDDADLRAYVREHLATQYEVLEAASGDEGLNVAKAKPPDVVVSDILMPGSDGYDLCRTLKADPETDFIPVILMSVKTDLPSRIEAFGSGADDCLVKPLDPAELLLRIRNHLMVRASFMRRSKPGFKHDEWYS
jgi:DNA-binding response OmpR family regulator